MVDDAIAIGIDDVAMSGVILVDEVAGIRVSLECQASERLSIVRDVNCRRAPIGALREDNRVIGRQVRCGGDPKTALRKRLSTHG
jgi:hypothetical protein